MSIKASMAIENNDKEELKNCIQQIANQIIMDKTEKFNSGIMRND